MKSIQLLFVYNADSSLFAKISDAVLKVVRPSAYTCNLCMVTYGGLTMKDEWRKFLDTLPYEKIFLHRDEFVQKYTSARDTALPALFSIQNGKVSLLVSSESIISVATVAGLAELIRKKLDELKL